MKRLLVIINFTLGVLLVASFSANVVSGRKAPPAYSVKKRDAAQKLKPVRAAAAKPAGTTAEEKVQTILGANIFNSDRCPNASVRGRSRRIELSLLGTFRIGTLAGAIIRQKGGNTNSRTNNRSPFNMGGMGGGPPMMPGMMNGGPPGERESGNSGRGSRSTRSNHSTRSTGSRRGGVRRFGGMGMMMMPGMNNSRNDETATAAVTGVKQYIRVGETMTNGYTLTEVTRTRATLTRGSSKLELEIEDPSKNQQKAVASTRRNTGRQFLQNQLRTQQQMMRVMQQMQRGMMMNNFMMGNMSRTMMRNNGNRGRNRR